MKALRGLREADLRIARAPPKVADAYYLTAEWKALRLACLKRDGFRCVLCGEPAVVADHIASRKAGGADALDKLRSLCRLHDNRLREGPGGTRAPEGGGLASRPDFVRNRSIPHAQKIAGLELR